MTIEERARLWLDAEPDEDMRAELRALIDGDAEQLRERFDGRLQFGTAGLRGAVGAGPLRMNRLVVRQAAAGLVDYLIDNVPDAAERGLIVGFDARRKSDVFASDTARVAAARGMRVRIFDQRVPTPVLAWSITEVDAAAGVVVTASHNPPADNGYKVYLDDGSQIVAPYDAAISAHIDRFDPTSVELADLDDPLIETVGESLVAAYVDYARSVRLAPDVDGVAVAYTALHGVGGAVLERAFAAAGLPAPFRVDDQHEPDGTFPTVAFPNPEEPGAMDRVIETARAHDALVALANDPDADRLGVAIPQPDGAWRRLTGDEIGWLLADFILTNTAGDRRMVVTTLVSSSMLATMAAHHGVSSFETFTGFKWIAHVTREQPDLDFVFGYEQALGYLVASRPRDKDGITAAILFAELVSVLHVNGETPQSRLDQLAAQFGRHITGEASVRMAPADAAARVAALQAEPPQQIGSRAVESIADFPEANLLRFTLAGGIRVQVRPSGTEPKVKVYGEAIDESPQPFIDALATLLSGA